ncbi:MAG: hypothetical protein AAGN82_17560 [Myxococcota bacterium]
MRATEASWWRRRLEAATLTGGLMLGFAVACGGAATGARGPEFCDSYERNYVEACLQQCEADLDPGEASEGERCASDCRDDLASDVTWTEDCAPRS